MPTRRGSASDLVLQLTSMSDIPTIHQVARFLEQWAPRASAQSYDNVGLQVGDPQAEVHTAVLALDMTPAVLEEARAVEASLVITHHPLIFRPLRHVTTAEYTSNLTLRLAAEGVALYSIHTNLDAASGGVSFALGRQLGLTDLEFLDAFDPETSETGMGAVGRLDPPRTLEYFLHHVAGRLRTPSLRYVGDPSAHVERIAVCGGAGSGLVHTAAAAGADAYVTADVKYHEFFNALDADGRPRLAFVDAGHYETEAVTEVLLAEELQKQFPTTSWRRTATRTSPVRTYVAAP
jgi:dinuclear metal center YbgI/SA1388 family protein